MTGDVLDAFERMGRNAASDLQVDGLLRHLCAAVADLLDVAGAGAMRIEAGRSVYVHATEARSDHLERVQDLLQQGPCLQAAGTRRTVQVDDLSATSRWPELGAAAAEVGVHSAVSLPLAVDEEVWGVLDLYTTEPGRIEGSDLRVARALIGVAAGYVAVARERDAARRAQAELTHRALRDPLTGVANRALLHDRLQHGLQVARRAGTRVGVLFIDLDRSLEVNDAFGPAVGDRVLREVTQRLQRVLRSGDTLARMGGGEFVILCEGLPADTADQQLEALSARVRAALAQASRVGAGDLSARASVGSALASADQDDPESVVHAVDTAVREAKARRRWPTAADVPTVRRAVRSGLLQVECEDRPDESLLRLRGELDIAGAPAVRGLLDEHAADGRGTVVDLTGLVFTDLSGLRPLATERVMPDGRRHPVTLVGASDLTLRVLTIAGLQDLLRRDEPPTRGAAG